MHRCSSSNGSAVGGACTCGVFHSQSNSFSILFSTPNHKPFDEYYSEMYSFNSSSSSYSSSVDCTLSLGTPSTRLSSGDGEKRAVVPNQDRRSSFCWDHILQSKNIMTPSSPPTHRSTTTRGNNIYSNSSSGGGGDPLLARRCANCDTTSTPLWRNGPRGPKSLCNACGIRFKKEERRSATASAAGAGGAALGGVMDPPPHHMMNNPWAHHPHNSQKVPCFSPTIGNEFRFIADDVDRDSDAGSGNGNIPFLSWRLNVTDRPGLVHDFTR